MKRSNSAASLKGAGMAYVNGTFAEFAPLINMVARKCGIVILPGYGKDTFCTDGKVMYFPDSGVVSYLSDNAAIGAIIHEGAHCAYTDFGAARGLAGLEFSVLNLLEDIRIEQVMTLVLPGSATYLNELVENLLAEPGRESENWRKWWTMKPADGTPETAIANIIYRLGRMLRVDLLSQNTLRGDGALSEQEERVAQAAYDLATAALSSAKRTGDLVDTAKCIVDLLVKQQQQQHQQQQQEQQEQQGQQGQQEQEGGGGKNDAESQAKDAVTSGNGCGKASQSLEQSLRAKEVGTDLLGAFDSNTDAQSTSQAGRLMERESQVGQGTRNTMVAWEPDEAAQAAARVLSRDIERALIAKSDEEFEEKRGTRVNQSLLAQYRTKSEVFVRDEFEDCVNTDVVILVDESGSMLSKKQQAHTACYAIEQALKRIPDVCATWILFNGRIHLVQKGETASRIYYPSGSTDWELAVAAGMQVLHRSSADRRKMIITITDGDLGKAQEAVKAFQTMARNRFEHHALGIGLSKTERDLTERCADSVTFVGASEPIDKAICKVFIRSLMTKLSR